MRQRLHGESRGETASGPLAVTYDRDTRRDRHVYSRFDSIWVSPEFSVDRVDHLWDDATDRPEGGSDHAMVVASLTPSLPPSRHAKENTVSHIKRTGIIPDGTTLVLNSSLIEDDGDRAQLQKWVADNQAGRAIWSNRGRELTWALDHSRHTVSALARRICVEAGIQHPGAPPGPHWWLDPASEYRSLVQMC